MYISVVRKGLISIIIALVIFCVLMLYLSIRCLCDDLKLMIVCCLILSFIIIVLGRELVWGVFSNKFYISRNGVKYIKRRETYSLGWNEIYEIRLASNKDGCINKHSMLCFDGRNIDESLYRPAIKSYQEYNKLYFGVQYRPKIMKEIKKYWDKPIQGIYQIEGKGKV